MNGVKKYGSYIAVLFAGLFLGYLFFGESKTNEQKHKTTASEQAYTCAMHSQVHRNEMGACPLCGMDLVVAQNNTLTLAAGQFQMTENAMALANIETTKIGIGNLDGNTLKLSGKITSNDKTNAVQTTDFDGRIEKLLINTVGQYIKKGKQIGTIYSPDLYAAQDQLLTSVSYKETHEKLFAAARNNSGLWKLTDAQINEVIRTKKPISRFPIVATVNGTVTEVIAAEGSYFKEGAALFKVSNLYSVWAVFDAYENQLPMLKVGQNIRISSNSFNGNTYEAKIAFIDPILDVEKRTVSLRATLINKGGLLKPGMFVEGRVETTDSNQVLTVPKSAVLWTGKRSLVYVKPHHDRPVFEMTEVQLGSAFGNSYRILSGLTAGDEVVTNGTFTVDAAAQLQGKKSMMTKKDLGIPISDGDVSIQPTVDMNENFTMTLLLYDELKNALVSSNSAKANSDAKKLVAELNKLTGIIFDKATTTQNAMVLKQAEKMAATQDLKTLRTAFKPLSEALVSIASRFSNLDQPIYVQHCPMADNNSGANWLSFEEEIRNPYYGDAMLTCGSVNQTIQ